MYFTFYRSPKTHLFHEAAPVNAMTTRQVDMLFVQQLSTEESLLKIVSSTKGSSFRGGPARSRVVSEGTSITSLEVLILGHGAQAQARSKCNCGMGTYPHRFYGDIGNHSAEICTKRATLSRCSALDAPPFRWRDSWNECRV